MNKRISPKLTLLIILAGLIVVMVGLPVEVKAGTGGTVGGIYCYADKSVSTYLGAWSTSVSSSCVASIGTIGWTYWTDREICQGTITWQLVRGGYAVYNRSSVSMQGQGNSYHTCPPGVQRTLQGLGNHDFKQGIDVWRPYVEATAHH